MKFIKHKKITLAWKPHLSPIMLDVPSPFFSKPFAGFVYVEKRRKKPGMGEQGMFE